MKTILFACVHNAGRSQMAAAWFNKLCDPTLAQAISAGTDPAPGVHANVIVAMREVSVDISTAKPRFLSHELASSASMLITMGCGEACPVIPGIVRQDWPVEDPKGKGLPRVREIRDHLHGRVNTLLLELFPLPK